VCVCVCVCVWARTRTCAHVCVHAYVGTDCYQLNTYVFC